MTQWFSPPAQPPLLSHSRRSGILTPTRLTYASEPISASLNETRGSETTVIAGLSHRPTPQTRRRSYSNLCYESSAGVMNTGLSPVVPLQENFHNFKPEDVAANGIPMRRDE